MSKNCLLSYHGQKLTLTEIARMNQINYISLRDKYEQTRDIEQAITLAKAVQRGPHQQVDFCGQKMTINQIAQIYGITPANLRMAYEFTADIDEAITLAMNHYFVDYDEKNFLEYQSQENTESIHKLKNLTHTIRGTDLKIDHTLLNNSVEPISAVEDQVFFASLKKQIATLPVNEQRVLNLRYGLNDGIEHTLEEISHSLGVSRARVGQIECHGLRRLRNLFRREYRMNELDNDENFIADMKKEVASMPVNIQKVVCLLYGLVDNRCYSYKEIAQELHLSTFQVMCTEKIAMQSLPYGLSRACEKRRRLFEVEVSFSPKGPEINR